GGIGQRTPDHIAGYGEAQAGNRNSQGTGQRPQHAEEAGEKQRGLEQSDAEISGDLGETPRVLMDALVGIDTDLSGIGQSDRPPRLQPFDEQVAGHPLTRLELDHLAQPGLRYIERQQAPRNQYEDEELMAEPRKVAVLHGVIEGLVPGIEQDLPAGR